MPNQHVPDRRKLTLAIVDALQMWSDEAYRSFLSSPSQTAPLTDKWFNWFVAEWKVARTIKKDCRETVRRYLANEFRQAVLTDGADSVDAAAKHIQNQGWSSKTGKSKRSSRPISLVSKIGFFLNPANLVPYDSYAVEGLNVLRRELGSKSLSVPTYQTYWSEFNEQFRQFETHLTAALQASWVTPLATALCCSNELQSQPAFRRKVFDNYLMYLGDWGKANIGALEESSI